MPRILFTSGFIQQLAIATLLLSLNGMCSLLFPRRLFAWTFQDNALPLPGQSLCDRPPSRTPSTSCAQPQPQLCPRALAHPGLMPAHPRDGNNNNNNETDILSSGRPVSVPHAN
jgi:hypothetical protein